MWYGRLAVMLYGRLAVICMGGWQRIVWEAGSDLYGRVGATAVGTVPGADCPPVTGWVGFAWGMEK